MLGARCGELGGLNYTKHIDWELERVIIERTLTKNKERKIVMGATTKTGRKNIKSNNSAIRFIPFDVFDKEQLIDILEEQIIIANNNPNNCEHLLFCKKDGTYIIPSQINQIFKRVCRKAGVKLNLVTGCNTHMTKHTFVTRAIESGMSLLTISKLVGTSVRELEKTYAHVLDKFMKVELEGLRKHLKNRFDNEKQFGNIYSSFFKSCLLRLITMFKEYDQIIIDNIFHDKTTEMELHPYFNTNAIKQIRMQQLLEENKRIFFETNQIEFIYSDHRKGNIINSQFIQLVDIVLGRSLNVIHNNATNNAKKELSFKIKPLIERILSPSNIFQKRNSHYNFFNKQSISFFPKISKESLENNIKYYYSNNIDFDLLLKQGNYFSNTKELLLKEDTCQISLFD